MAKMSCSSLNRAVNPKESEGIRRDSKESEEIRMDQRIEVNREKKYIFNCRIYKRQKKKHFPVAQFDCVLVRFVCRFAFFRWHC